MRRSNLIQCLIHEIASVALLPRNDAGNSKIPYKDPPRGLGDDKEQSSWGILDEIASAFSASQ